MSWRGVVLRVLRVPPNPVPPPGTPPRVFRAANAFYVLRVLRFLFVQIFAAMGAVLMTVFLLGAMEKAPRNVITTILVVEAVTWTIFFAQLLFGLSVVRLDYEMRWYMLSDRAIRVREGIATVREKTITLANVQNISIRQGPLQRLLSIADVEVQTAGGGGSGAGPHGQKGFNEPGHVAYFRGVANPEEIRNLLIEGVRRQKDSGLGDHDDHRQPHAERGDDVQTAIAELLAEAGKLRESVERT